MRTRTPCAGRAAGRSAVLRPGGLALLLGLGLAGLAVPAAGQGLRYTRPIEVPAPGWVRVPLAPEILREAAPAGGSLRLFGPEGEEVPFRRVLSDTGGEWVRAGVISGTPTATGWRAELEVAAEGTASEGQANSTASDTGVGPARHDRLRLDLAPAVLAKLSGPSGSIELEGSDDGATWRLLTLGRPEVPTGSSSSSNSFNTSGGSGTIELAYPATAARYLRLTWSGVPEASAAADSAGATGGSPEGSTASGWIRSASVETVPARSLGVTVPRPECRSAVSGADGEESGEEGEKDGAAAAGRAVGPRTICTLPVASAGRHLRRLDLVVTGEGRIGFRLLDPEDGRWEPVADGVWTSPLAETPHSLGLDLDLPRPAEPLRLELYGGADAAPGLARADAELAGEALIFRARRAGRHTLAYGAGVFRGSRAEEARIPQGVEPRRIEPGPETEGSVPTATAPLPESAGPAPSVQFERRWTVRAESPVAGALYRLPLLAETYAVARPDLADLRLISGSVQVPYVHWRPEEPATVTTVRGAVPAEGQPADGSDAGSPLRVGIDLHTPGLPLSALVVHAAPGPGATFHRRVRVLAVEPPAAGDDATREPLSPWLDWTCTPRPPLSCRLAIALDDDQGTALRRSGRLELEIESPRGRRGGGAAGASAADSGLGSGLGPGLGPGLDLELWRRQDLLLFPWPAGDAPFRLTAGAEDLEAPDYDLAQRRDELLARPSRRAEMVAPSPDGRGVRNGGWVAGWTVGLTLAVALGVLLFLLDRILAEREAAPPSG